MTPAGAGVGGLPTAPRAPLLARLRERWADLRNRWLADPQFRDRAARFWPSRLLARRAAAELFGLTAGFVYTQVLLACVRLRVFDALEAGPRGTRELAAVLGLDPAGAERLLAAAASLRLVERRTGQRWALGRAGAPLVRNPGVCALVEHHALLYADLADPVDLLRRGQGSRLAAYWPYAGSPHAHRLGPTEVAPYTRLMAASQPLVAEPLLAAYPFGRHRCVLDVGGGDGTFLRRLGERHPHLQRVLFDLPGVAQLAAAHPEPQLQVHAGDFRHDPLPAGADLVTLLRVLHDHDEPEVLALLRRVHAALPPGGAVVVAEPMADTPGARAMGDAYFGFYLLAMGRGRPRSWAALAGLLRQAGFDEVQHVPTSLPLQVQVLVARRK